VQLVSRVFPDLREVDQALNYYIKQLTDPCISLAVNQHCPNNIREAVSATLDRVTILPDDVPCHVARHTRSR